MKRKQCTISFTADSLDCAVIIELLQDRIEMYDYKIQDLLINEVDVEATMGTPPDGETVKDAYFEKMEEDKVEPDYAVSNTIDPLFQASELLARHADSVREQNERIIELLESVADELIVLVDTFVEDNNA